MKNLGRITRNLFAALCIVLTLIAPAAPALAATLTANFTMQTNINYTGLVGLSSASAPVTRASVVSLANGTGTNQANMVYTVTLALSPSTTTNLDLAGTLLDAFGTTITFTSVKAVIVESAGTNTVDMTVGNGTNPFIGWFSAGTVTEVVKPGGVSVHIAPQTGWSVTAATADILKFVNGAGAGTWYVTLVGTV